MDSPRWRLCIPKGTLRQRLLALHHDCSSSGHPGRDKTYSKLCRDYFWPGMSRDVNQYVRSCDKCQRVKGDRPQQNLLPAFILASCSLGRDYNGPSDRTSYIISRS